MRRMYSEQELTNVIKAVFEQELEDGALDDKVVDAVDDYLTEHPVDPTAITGLDIAPKDVTASGNITAPSIIETMSGYSWTKITTQYDWDDIFVGVCKNGNTLHIVLFGSLNIDTISDTYIDLGYIQVPSSIADKLYPYNITGYSSILDNKLINLNDGTSIYNYIEGAVLVVTKDTNKIRFRLRNFSGITLSNPYYFRIEETFLLGDNLASE